MDCYLGEIRLFASYYAPVGWAFCTGQAMKIADYQALFAVMGTTYGGDGVTTFNLPDLRGLLACGTGKGAGLANNYALGQTFGAAGVAVTQSELPSHAHPMIASTQPASSTAPAGNLYAVPTCAEYANTNATVRALNSGTLTGAGGSAAHANLMPTLAVSFIICTNGLFPS